MTAETPQRYRIDDYGRAEGVPDGIEFVVDAAEYAALQSAHDKLAARCAELERDAEGEAVAWTDESLDKRADVLGAVDDAMVNRMVDRFLSWRLPKPWHPDNGISYTRPNYAHAHADHDWPTGTNLFDAAQAKAMIGHLLMDAAIDAARSKP